MRSATAAVHVHGAGHQHEGKTMHSRHGITAMAMMAALLTACGGNPPPESAATPAGATTAGGSAPATAADPAPATAEPRPISQLDAVRAEVAGDPGTNGRSVVESGLDAPELAALQDRIHFDFDRADLRESDRQKLRQKYEVLRRHPSLRIEIEGHCDERGPDEYNLALGLRRAAAARQYLLALGVGADRITVRSFGNERPLDTRQTEEAWALNRRAEFLITQAAR